MSPGLYKKIGIFSILAATVGVSFVFRVKISHILDFGTIEKGEVSLSSSVASSPDSAQTRRENPTTNQTPLKDSNAKKEWRTSAGLPLPPYTGRIPGEVRSVDDEVKLFSKDQKEKLYAEIHELGNAVEATPTFFAGWIQLGVLKKTIGDFTGARDAWEYAGLIEPLNSLSYANLGDLYWRYLHDYPHAEHALEISIKNKPDDVFTYVTLAEVYHYSYKEKYNEAPQMLLRGLEANPENETLMRRLAYLYEQRQEWGSALEWWKKVRDKSPNDEEVANKILAISEKIGQ